MAHIDENRLLEKLIEDPNWCLFYHRDQVRQLLPSMTKAFVLVNTIEAGLIKKLREKSAQIEESPRIIANEGWILAERYVRRYPYNWVLIFKRKEEVLEISVPEEVWRAFDGIPGEE